MLQICDTITHKINKGIEKHIYMFQFKDNLILKFLMTFIEYCAICFIHKMKIIESLSNQLWTK